jgi:hypothetical protein
MARLLRATLALELGSGQFPVPAYMIWRIVALAPGTSGPPGVTTSSRARGIDRPQVSESGESP